MSTQQQEHLRIEQLKQQDGVLKEELDVLARMLKDGTA